MNNKQKYLLKLLKEIDDICKKEDIEYYLAAGTMLGAVRHRGFIPWDDDADVIMTKSNYDKFVNYFEKNVVHNRAFQYRGNNNKYPMIIGRYYDTNTTGLQRGTAWDIVPAGQYIDIMILIPLPKNDRLKEKVMERIILYVELNNDMYTDNANRGEKFLRKYKFFLKLRKILGKERILKWLESKIFCFSEDDCDEYMISHAIGNKLIYEKAFFEEQLYVPFEDTKLPIPKNYLDLFWFGYGSSWRMIPRDEEKETHVVIDDYNRKYDIYVNDYMQFLNKKEVLYNVFRRKALSIDDAYKRLSISPEIHKMNALKIKIDIYRKIEEENINLENLIVCRNFDKIGEIFEKYEELQFKESFLYWNIFFDLDDEMLYYPLYRWIFYTGEYSRAKKVLNLRNKERGLSNRLDDLADIIETIETLYYFYDYKKYDELFALIDKANFKWKNQIDFLLFHLWKIKININDEKSDYGILLKEAIRISKLFPKNGECIKYIADAYKGIGNNKDALYYYDLAEKLSSNGETLLYIKDVKEEYYGCCEE